MCPFFKGNLTWNFTKTLQKKCHNKSPLGLVDACPCLNSFTWIQILTVQYNNLQMGINEENSIATSKNLLSARRFWTRLPGQVKWEKNPLCILNVCCLWCFHAELSRMHVLHVLTLSWLHPSLLFLAHCQLHNLTHTQTLWQDLTHNTPHTWLPQLSTRRGGWTFREAGIE